MAELTASMARATLGQQRQTSCSHIARLSKAMLWTGLLSPAIGKDGTLRSVLVDSMTLTLSLMQTGNWRLQRGSAGVEPASRRLLGH
jgi:hypothetical protein